MNREEIKAIANESYLGYEVDIDNVVCFTEKVLEKEYHNTRIDVCGLCCNEDFGYCGLRKNPIELEYKHDQYGNLSKCSGFVADKCFVERRFKIQSKRSE